ncbi:hypothetical protein OG871_40485 (plasmid) [Kitasatospora sp. NBC_00374]|uniref:hypothetical protein n=1 Tax=Kitasatospora sp. NBC_00374 TaxID=2975964 RepID=UPI002F91056B
MPLHLPGPEPVRPAGGWNRFSLNAHMTTPDAQCALCPRSWAALLDSRRDTRLCAWGPYGSCVAATAAPDCTACPVFAARNDPGRSVEAGGDHVFVRIDRRIAGEMFTAFPVDRMWLTAGPGDADFRTGEPWTWDQVSRLTAWTVGRRVLDETGEGFWLHRTPTGPTAPADTATAPEENAGQILCLALSAQGHAAAVIPTGGNCTAVAVTVPGGEILATDDACADHQAADHDRWFAAFYPDHDPGDRTDVYTGIGTLDAHQDAAACAAVIADWIRANT